MAHRTTILLDDDTRAAVKDLSARLQVPASEAIRRAIHHYRNQLQGVSPEQRRQRVAALRELVTLFEGYDPTRELEDLDSAEDF